MKRYLAAILAILYVASSTGAGLTMHYCMGRAGEWGLGTSSAASCSVCGMEKKDGRDKGCCHDEHKFVKITSDQKAPETTQMQWNSPVAVLPSYGVLFSLPALQPVSLTRPVSHAPPGTGIVPLVILHRRFLI